MAEAGGGPRLEARIEAIMLCSLLGVAPERVGLQPARIFEEPDASLLTTDPVGSGNDSSDA